MVQEQQLSADDKLQAILEYYFRQYFKERKPAVDDLCERYPFAFNKEFVGIESQANVEDFVETNSRKLNDILLMLLDLYILNNKELVLEYELDMLKIAERKILPAWRELRTNGTKRILLEMLEEKWRV